MTNSQQQAVDQLRRSRKHPDCRRAAEGNWDDASTKAALSLAQALGQCRIRAADPGDEDGMLPAAWIAPICRVFRETIDRAIDRLTSFEARIELAKAPEEEEATAAEQLKKRMDGWAIWIAIDEGIEAAEMASPPAPLPGLDAALLDSVLMSLQQWDTDLRARADLLLPVRNSVLLDNWRAELAEPFSRQMPWWMDEPFWENVKIPPLPDVSLFPVTVAAPEPHGTPVRPRIACASTWQAIPNRFAQQLAIAADVADRPVRHPPIDFCSRTDGQGAIARIELPTRLARGETLVFDVRFLRRGKDSDAVRIGQIVHLTGGFQSPVLLEFDAAGKPAATSRFQLSEAEVETLCSVEQMQLRVGDQFWFMGPRNH